MNFIVDAQLPRRLAGWLIAAGCDAVHTLDLPDGNRTTDLQVIDVAERERRADEGRGFRRCPHSVWSAREVALDLDGKH